MENVSQYLDIPALIAFSLMTVVLVELRRDKTGRVRLWIVALALIALEGVARAIYMLNTHSVLHNVMHVIALDAYFLAGVTFLESASTRFVHRSRPGAYMTICTVPYVLLASCYGAMVTSRPVFLAIGVFGLVVSVAAAFGFKRPRFHMLVHVGMWLPVVLIITALGDVRQTVYTALAMVFGLTAVAFYRGLPRALKGRLVIVTGMMIWSMCFLFHPWLAQYHREWIPLQNQIWDLQKFVVMFGLLVISLEEHSVRSEYQAQHDELTGLGNRRLFDDHLEAAVMRARQQGSRVLIFTMDLNDFKQVNDTFGHEAGDELLRAVSARMRVITRQCDTLARVGGDEFQLIATSFGSGSDLPTLRGYGQLVAEKFRQAAEQPLMLRNGQSLAPSISIGFAVFPDETKTAEELCYKADRAMYVDKQRRRGVHGSTSAPELEMGTQAEWLN